MAAFPLLFVVLGVIMLQHPRSESQAIAWLWIVGAGLLSAGYAYLLYLKLSGRAQRSTHSA
jgi:hypothetical protein